MGVLETQIVANKIGAIYVARRHLDNIVDIKNVHSKKQALLRIDHANNFK